MQIVCDVIYSFRLNGTYILHGTKQELLDIFQPNQQNLFIIVK